MINYNVIIWKNCTSNCLSSSKKIDLQMADSPTDLEIPAAQILQVPSNAKRQSDWRWSGRSTWANVRKLQRMNISGEWFFSSGPTTWVVLFCRRGSQRRHTASDFTVIFQQQTNGEITCRPLLSIPINDIFFESWDSWMPNHDFDPY